MPSRRKSVEDTEDTPHEARPADANMKSPRARGRDGQSDVKEEIDEEDIKLMEKKKRAKRPRSWFMFFAALAPMFVVMFGSYCYTHLHVFISLCAYHPGLVRVVKLLLDNGVDANKLASKDSMSMLQEAVYVGNSELITTLLDGGAEINFQEKKNNFTAATIAVTEGKIEVLNTLIDRGADLHLQAIDGLNVLHRASAFGKTDVVKILLDKGQMDITSQSGGSKLTPLHWATEQNFAETVKLLLEYAAPLGITDSLGQTPIHSAALKAEKTEILAMLLDAGADPGVIDLGGMSALHVAYSELNIPGADILLERAAENIDITLKLADDSTYMHWAALADHGRMIDALIAEGFSPTTVTTNGETPLFWAVKMGNVDAMGKILNGAAMMHENSHPEEPEMSLREEHGVDGEESEDAIYEDVSSVPKEFIDPMQHRDANGNSLLHVAASHNQKDIVIKLVEMDFDVNERNAEGKTPLWLACDVRHHELAQMLVKKLNADPTIGDNDGRPIEMGCLNENVNRDALPGEKEERAPN